MKNISQHETAGTYGIEPSDYTFSHKLSVTLPPSLRFDVLLLKIAIYELQLAETCCLFCLTEAKSEVRFGYPPRWRMNRSEAGRGNQCLWPFLTRGGAASNT